MDISRYCAQAVDAAVPGECVTDPELARSHPIIHAFLTTARGPDGKPQPTATLTVFADAQGFKIRLANRAQGFDLWAGGTSLSDAMAALESMFKHDPIPWRKAKVFGGGRVRQ